MIDSPGIYQGLSYEEYAAIPAVSRSLLAKLADTPADALAFMQGGGETTAPLEFGIGSHCLTLEPEKFATEFAIGPDVKLNTKEGKDAWAAFAAVHPRKRLVRGADRRDMLGMREWLFQHPLAKLLLTAPGLNEVVFVWRDKPTGLLCKIRIDRLIDDGDTIVDYKTTSDASASGFPRSAGDYLYFLQESFYRDGVESVLGVPPTRFCFIAQEKKTPYKANVFCFPSHRVAQGRKLYRDLLELYAACTKSGVWPAMDGAEYQGGVVEADIPEFAMKAAR